MARQLAPTPDQAPAFALQLFQHWLSGQTVNQLHRAAPHPAAQHEILDLWPRNCTFADLDLDRAADSMHQY